MKVKKLAYYLCLIMFFMNIVAYSQDPPDPGGGTHPEFPIDGGISLLLIAGAAYGVFALKKNKKFLLND